MNLGRKVSMATNPLFNFFGPTNGQEERTLLQSLYVMQKRAVQRK